MKKDQKKLVEAHLVLSDGTIFTGEMVGAVPEGGLVSGEVVFNTVLSGYQEVITDPSYAGQIITFTYPHIVIMVSTLRTMKAPPHFAEAS